MRLPQAPWKASCTFVAAPDRSALVYGYACEIDGAFVGVEVLVGDLASQRPHFANLDPTAVQSHDHYTVVTFDHRDGGAMPLRPTDLETWEQLVAASATSGGP